MLTVILQSMTPIGVRLNLLAAPFEFLVAAARTGRVWIDQGHRLASLGGFSTQVVSRVTLAKIVLSRLC